MSKEVLERGLEIRKAVLGREYVENSYDAADDFNRPLQELVTEYCWGAVWGREELPRKTRSMLNLAMLSALNRPHELKMHIKGALTNGVSREEIREVFLQVGDLLRRARPRSTRSAPRARCWPRSTRTTRA